MSSGAVNPSLNPDISRRNYAWVIVIACTLMMAVTYGIMYSFSVFFKPLAEHFNWDRATVSLIYSISLVMRGGISILTGWLADRYGAKKLMVFCGLMIGLGLILSSQAQSLWQLLLSYSLIEAIGLSGTFGITTAVTSRWFTRNRGLALGVVSSGVGIGTLLMVPGAEKLIQAVQWPQAFFIMGIVSGLIVIIGAFFLKPPPTIPAAAAETKNGKGPSWHSFPPTPVPDLSLKQAIVNLPMMMVIMVFCLLFFSTHIVMVHLVNYATDMGLSPLVAASLVSIIGVVSIAGRLVMGAGSDKLGMHNIIILVCGLLCLALFCLIFIRQLWAFYFFAVFFGFAYGGEVPQIPLLVSAIGGTRRLATLIGLTLFLGNVGGALGPWVAGKIFDLTGHYYWAFGLGAAAAFLACLLAFILKRKISPENRNTG
ncbi:MAG TPA: MFS transporter [Dehalococcoidales bacterium]|nr:MFS transporter [Dehalococcoidales bacterium]